MAASITCQHCGASAPQGTTFCPSCGEMLLETPAATAPATPPTTPVPEPQVVQVPRRPAPQPSAPRGRSRSQVPPTQAPRAPRGQGPFGFPPRPQQLPPQSGPFGGSLGPFGGSQGPFGLPQGRPVRTRRRGGCGTILFRLIALVIGLPILLSLAGRFLFGSGQEAAVPAPQPTSTQPQITLEPSSSATWPSSRATAPTAQPSLTIPPLDGTTPSSGSAATAYPSLVLTGQECRRQGTGPYAAAAAGNETTTCAFALATQDAYRRANPAPGQGIRITAWSQARGQDVALRCTGAQPVKCVSSTGALVYLYGGTARFR